MTPCISAGSNKNFLRLMSMCYTAVYVIDNQNYLMGFTELTDRCLSDICLRNFLTTNKIITNSPQLNDALTYNFLTL